MITILTLQARSSFSPQLWSSIVIICRTCFCSESKVINDTKHYSLSSGDFQSPMSSKCFLFDE